MFLSVIQCLLLVNMDILDLEMEQRSLKIEQAKKLVQEMEEEQRETEQVRQRELEEQKRNIQTDSTIQDLEDMVHADLSYNIPITYIDDIYGYSHRYSDKVRNHKIKQTTLFDYKKDYFRKNIVNYNKFKKREIGLNEIPHYPIQTFNGEPNREGPGRTEPMLRSPTTNILAETSDKFVAILNIVKQQDARIEEFERMFPMMRKRIIELERIVLDKDDSVVEERVNEEPPVEETEDELTSESDSDVEV